MARKRGKAPIPGKNPTGLKIHSPTRPAAIAALDRRLEALELRREGHGFPAIGAKLGVTKQRAHQLVTEALAELRADFREEAEAVRDLMIVRLDAMVVALWPFRFDPPAAQAILKIEDRRAKLLGLDAPVKHALGGIDGAPAIPVGGPPDLTRYTVDELRQLHTLATKAVAP